MQPEHPPRVAAQLQLWQHRGDHHQRRADRGLRRRGGVRWAIVSGLPVVAVADTSGLAQHPRLPGVGEPGDPRRLSCHAHELRCEVPRLMTFVGIVLVPSPCSCRPPRSRRPSRRPGAWGYSERSRTAATTMTFARRGAIAVARSMPSVPPVTTATRCPSFMRGPPSRARTGR